MGSVRPRALVELLSRDYSLDSTKASEASYTTFVTVSLHLAVILLSSRLFKHSIRLILLHPSNMRPANWRLIRGDFGVVTVGVFSVELLDALSSPPEWVSRSESSSKIAEGGVSSSSITLVEAWR